MKGDRDPLAWSQLWAVRWLSGTFLILQLIFGAIGVWAFSYRSPFINFWMGAALSMVPGFVIGFFIQRRMNPAKLSENDFTVRLLGLMAVAVTVFAVAEVWNWPHAG